MTDKFNESVEMAVAQEAKPKRQIMKKQECKILRYNQDDNTLDVLFDHYGLRFNNVAKDYSGEEFATIKYKGTIGKANFVYKLDD